jgi:photosystem II stability/assembly factor-like uncharacterized protein
VRRDRADGVRLEPNAVGLCHTQCAIADVVCCRSNYGASVVWGCSGQTAWAVGESGTVVTTSDSGDTWTATATSVTADYFGVR